MTSTGKTPPPSSINDTLLLLAVHCDVQNCPIWVCLLGYWPAFSSFLSYYSFCSLSPHSRFIPLFLCSSSSCLTCDISFYLSWYQCPTVPLLHHHQVPWLCGNHHHLWYQWASLQPVTVDPQGVLPSSLPGRPLRRSVCDVCYQRRWKVLCCTLHLTVTQSPSVSFEHHREDVKYIQYILNVFSSQRFWVNFICVLFFWFSLWACEWVLITYKYNYNNNKTILLLL